MVKLWRLVPVLLSAGQCCLVNLLLFSPQYFTLTALFLLGCLVGQLLVAFFCQILPLVDFIHNFWLLVVLIGQLEYFILI